MPSTLKSSDENTSSQVVHSTIREPLQRAHGEPSTPISGQDGLVKVKTPNNRDIRKSVMRQKMPEAAYGSAPRLGDSGDSSLRELSSGGPGRTDEKEVGKTRQE